MPEGTGTSANHAIKAGDRTLKAAPGDPADQFVALWYVHGEPVMGRIWNNNGKVAAAFGWGGKAFTDQIGSIQVLCELPDHVRGFDYHWCSFKEAAIFDKNQKQFFPVHVDSVKGNISPCLLTLPNGTQALGKVDIRNEKASAVINGKEEQFVGPTVQQFLVLCRKAKPGQKFDE